MLEKTGIVTKDRLDSKINELLSSPKRKGAILECYEEIPCNPCSTSCPTNAIIIKPDINAKPEIDYEKCTACGICVYNCPGLAILVLDMNYSESNVLFKISYELLPIPNNGDIVKGISRSGKEICDVEVVKVINGNKQDHTSLISVAVPKEHFKEFVTIKVGV
ncbi:4Fe-4S binding protein [Mycoplasmatota bacterium zrk1]